MVPRILYILLCIFCSAASAAHRCGCAHTQEAQEAQDTQDTTDDMRDTDEKTLTYYIARSGAFATFKDALEQAKLLGHKNMDFDLLANVRGHLDMKQSKLENITIFVPHEKAFRDMPDYIRDQLFASPRKMRDVLLYHMVSGRYTSDQFDDGVKSTLFNERITIQKLDNGTYILDGHARIINSDVIATDGVIHTIDRILLP